MRRILSATVLLVATAASVATSKLPTPTTTTSLVGPAAELEAGVVDAWTLDVLASQSPAGPFAGAVLVDGHVTTPGAATVTAILSVLDGAGAVELARDTVVVSRGTEALFLFDDVDAFGGCPDGSQCDQTFRLELHTTGDATVGWSFEAELHDADDSGRTGELGVFLR